MKKTALLFMLAIAMAIAPSCKHNKQISKKQVRQKEVKNYLTVDETIASAEKLSNKTVHLIGTIEHVCKHGGKKFNIISAGGKNELKIELDENFESLDLTVIGNNVKVTGKLISHHLDAEQVKQWEQKMRDNHKGEENTQHFKDELKQIEDIHAKIITGKIPYYTNYTVKCENYEFE